MELKKGDILYYRGLSWGEETYVFRIIEEDGKKIVHANNGVKRDYDSVVNNKCDLYTSKEEINKSHINCYMASFIE